MSKRAILAAIIYPMANAVLFGLSAIIVLTLFNDSAKLLLPIAIGASVVLAAPIAWFLAPSLSLRLSGRLGAGAR